MGKYGIRSTSVFLPDLLLYIPEIQKNSFSHTYRHFSYKLRGTFQTCLGNDSCYIKIFINIVFIYVYNCTGNAVIGRKSTCLCIC